MSLSMNLKWADWTLELDRRTHIMGILNVTPDSFSDGGRYLDRERAVEHGISMVRQGADIIDVGGESTRPYSRRVSKDQELARVIPVIEDLAKEIDVPISIDTYKADVAREAIKAGASIINDISALRFDPMMGKVAAEAGVPIVLMHMQGTPETMQDNPCYEDVVAHIKAFFEDAIKRAEGFGISHDLVILDPGIGFGKNLDHNLTIIKNLSCFSSLGRPILLGASNKAFVRRIAGKDALDMGTAAATVCGIISGAHIVRVHNVSQILPAVRMADAIKRA